MSDNVDSLLLQLQEKVEDGRKIGRMRLVDPLELQDLLESVRAALPNTIERAKEIVAKRGEILEEARNEADRMLSEASQKAAETEANANARVQEVVQHAKEHVRQMLDQGEQGVAEAKEEAQRLVEEHSVTRAAQEQANALLQQARAGAEKIESESRQISQRNVEEAQNYSQDLLQRTEEWGKQYTDGVCTVAVEIVNEAAEILASSLTDIRTMQKRLQVSITKSATPPEFDAPEEPRLF